MIFRNFNHWFSNSKTLGLSSSSRDWAQEIWEELVPTIEASLDDHKKAYIKLSEEKAHDRSELVDHLLEYIKEHKQPGQKNFWAWWLDQKIEGEE